MQTDAQFAELFKPYLKHRLGSEDSIMGMPLHLLTYLMDRATDEAAGAN